MSRKTASAPLSPEETRTWIVRYRKYSKIYAWSFLILLLPVIFVVIWISMGELNRDVFLSLGFFAVVTVLLALWTRKRAARSWTGQVADKFVKTVHFRANENRPARTEQRPMVEFRTDRGKKVVLRAGADQFGYFEVGDRVFKVSGLEWPEKESLDGDRRLCMICGALVSTENGACGRCRGPIPDHAVMRDMAG